MHESKCVVDDRPYPCSDSYFAIVCLKPVTNTYIKHFRSVVCVVIKVKLHFTLHIYFLTVLSPILQNYNYCHKADLLCR